MWESGGFRIRQAGHLVGTALDHWHQKPDLNFIEVKDFPECWKKLKITVEVEAKAKEAAVLKLKNELEQQPKPKKVRNKA